MVHAAFRATRLLETSGTTGCAFQQRGGGHGQPADADTFRILDSTEHPDEAITAMYYLLTEGLYTCLTAYGAGTGGPGASWTLTWQPKMRGYPQKSNWQTILDGANYADNPSHGPSSPDGRSTRSGSREALETRPCPIQISIWMRRDP